MAPRGADDRAAGSLDSVIIATQADRSPVDPAALHNVPLDALKVAVERNAVALDAAAARVAADYRLLLADPEATDETLKSELGLSEVEVLAVRQARQKITRCL